MDTVTTDKVISSTYTGLKETSAKLQDTLFLFEGHDSFQYIKSKVSLIPQPINRSISIIIPTMNENPAVLNAQIEFIQQQSYTHYEIIIVLDNPKKKVTLHTLGLHEQKNPHIHIITHLKNLGRSAARNTGAKNAKGELLIFLDTGILLHNKDTLKHINKFYSDPRNETTILKPRVLPNIENYGTHEFICGANASRTKFVKQKLFHEERFELLQNFESNFFGVYKKQYMKYPFDEDFGTRWGWEDSDWIRGQQTMKGILLSTGTIIAKVGSDYQEDDVAALIIKQIDGVTNLKKYDDRWSQQFPEETAKMRKEYLYGENREEEFYHNLFRKSPIEYIMSKLIQRYYFIHEHNQALYLIPKHLSFLESEALWEIVRTAMAYAYHTDERHIKKIISRLFPKIKKNILVNPIAAFRDSLARRRIRPVAQDELTFKEEEYLLWEQFSCAIEKRRFMSIIIPTMSESDELRAQIQYIKQQSYTHYEIIIVLDNPKKKVTLHTLGLHEQKNPHIHIITHLKNLGRSAARNTGAKNAKGELLIFLDTGILLHNKDTLKHINKFYSDPRNETTTLKPRVLPNIENYGTHEFITNAYDYPCRFYMEEGANEQSINDFKIFLSNFFVIRKERFMRYPFSEEFSTRWGVEDVDWAIGQINTGSIIMNTNSIVGLQRLTHMRSDEHCIANRLEGTYNMKYCEEKWNKSTFNEQLAMSRHYFLFFEDKYADKVITLSRDPQIILKIKEYLNTYRTLRAEHERLSLIPYVCSWYQMHVFRFIITLITYYAYTHCSTIEEFNTLSEALCH